MTTSLRKTEAALEPERPAVQSVKRQKLAVLLITGDDSLWPQIGADLNGGLILKQLDSIDELIATTPSDQAAIILWDARNCVDPAAELSRVQLHSSRFAILAMDAAASDAAWVVPIQHRQVVAHIGLPIVGSVLTTALDSAHEEVNSRLSLLGDGTAPVAPMSPASGSPKKPWLLPAAIGGALTVAALIFALTRHGSGDVKPATEAAAVPAKAVAMPAAAVKPAAEVDDKVDALIEKAQQAILDRHYIDPAQGSALSLYREILSVNPENGEARQGLQRLSEILISRVQSALDDRKFDVALQSLETARSIDPSDRRLAALDEKIASVRAELGPAQILAAMNAQNFDRATQLIDEAARSRALSAAKIAQLRDEVRRRREDSEALRLLKLVETRIQQDHVIDPHGDSAIYFLEQAKQAGAGGPALQAQVQELSKKLTQMARAAIQQRNLNEADRILTEMKGMGASQGSLTVVQRELTVARNQQTSQKPDVPQYLELAQSRLAQGKLTEPDNDSAVFYLSQLRAQDPKNSGLAALSTAVQAQVIDRARGSLDAGDLDRSEGLAQLAANMGASSEVDALVERIRQKKASGSRNLQMPEQSLTRLNKLEVQYPARALQTGVEGWVELGYTVRPDGTVTSVKVLNAAPLRVFETSATKAVSHLRYQPVVQGGKALAVDTQVRIVYRVPK